METIKDSTLFLLLSSVGILLFGSMGYGIYTTFGPSSYKLRDTIKEHARMHELGIAHGHNHHCLLYTSPSPRDRTRSRMPSSA